MIKKILVGIGGTQYTAVAMRRAVTLALEQEADITAVTVMRKEALLSGTEPSRAGRKLLTRESVDASLAQIQQQCREVGVRCDMVEETGEAFQTMTELARYHDLMVFGLRSVFQYDFGEPAERILVRLVERGVRPLIGVAEGYRQIQRVFVAYSGSMESAKAMKRFVQLRLWPQARLKIWAVHADEHQAWDMAHAASAYCTAHGYSVDTQTCSGIATGLLLDAARQWEADMIVMGNSVRSVLLRRVLGDTVLSVLRDTHLPVFLSQ